MSGAIRSDVVVVGGGIAACATAIALARTGVRTGLSYSVTTRPRLAVGETVPPDVRKLLGELGAWEKFLEQRHEACLGSCSAWGGTELGYNDFVLNPQGSGWHLDRARFEALLLGEAESRGVALFPIAKCASLEQAADGGIVLGAITPSGDGRHLTARYIVDATGSRSVIARQMGARQIPLDRLSFVYGFFDAPEAAAPSQLTLLEAQELGWWYKARLPDRRLAIAFASDASIIRDHNLAHASEWLALLRTTSHVAQAIEGYRLKDIVVRAAPSFRLDRVTGANWLAVGDAAAACDPISSQGIMNALEDGIRAAAAIAGVLGGRSDGNDRYARYLDARYTEYVVNRNYLYGLERRWPKSPFWQRRYARGGAAQSAEERVVQQRMLV
ncbi:tryptophan 7-halogenase [Bradyrhizobium sp. CCGUVB4N]|uniref:tryptophan 7-halogenase n=1 Tax=Bradyrhizobium sp. CCGUVB4N TaxID=2949631 RepID=UPI0020B25804|nr:tryptophan 7-halogenase [Bradyrhizobium sp. CCGUVB4N]MCP3384897.1 tryptophan 7-halogenase [Bradyrhizobium sp. CCGUVB4N]